ncbi:Signal transduction histidine kinase CheA [Halanaerobium saccharolyticum subsp. saccharolyticum DSM 6643]|uniref:Chemotaxis protein CheA n=1 Tax=Halanaerobium saccharolyticum subsp. saccharolyticum DSM 6643 TaxID=1293054 RepID=M5E3D8_9FIRM|nr:chemotaxis protein CheA [Halanaerobium saccharolyticum]CCU80805.1 Signal transduction histidine kinase CheA [Halanaerobium saccharolyticum subsp. saccharolyticum DSM 6643]
MQENEYLKIFFAEAKEYIEVLNNGILTLENNPEDKETIDAIFRAAHSLKGMAAAMGFEKLTELTHKLENSLDKIREGEIKVKTEFIDLLFQALDNIQYLVKAVEENNGKEPEGFDLDALIAELNAYTEANDFKESQTAAVDTSENVRDFLTEAEKEELLERKKDKEKVYHLKAEVVDEEFKSVRAFMLLKKLDEIGQLFKSEPPRNTIENSEADIDQLNIIALSWLEKEEFKTEIEAQSSIKLISLDELQSSEIKIDSEKESKSNTVQKNKVSSFNSSSTVRVDISKLDTLMNMVGELLINKSRLESLDIKKTKFKEIMPQLDRVTMDLHHIVMQIRMVPVGVMFSRFPRMMRDLANKMNKEIDFVMSGQETELDRSIIDELADPLTHLLRNAIDHGIEKPAARKAAGKDGKGKVELLAYQKGSEIIIEVKDDGAGIKAAAIAKKAVDKGIIEQEEVEQLEKRDILDFVFHPGFSTAQEITDVSGRGVGMDIVRSTVKKLDGQVSIDSEPGEGSTFKITLPLTLAISQALMVKIIGDTFAIPLSAVSETLTIETENIKKIRGKDVIVLRETTIPIVSAAAIFGDDDQKSFKNSEKDLSVVILKSGERKVGLVVEELLNQQEIVIKSLGKYLQETRYISGATIIGDGDVALIVDVRDVVSR